MAGEDEKELSRREFLKLGRDALMAVGAVAAGAATTKWGVEGFVRTTQGTPDTGTPQVVEPTPEEEQTPEQFESPVILKNKLDELQDFLFQPEQYSRASASMKDIGLHANELSGMLYKIDQNRVPTFLMRISSGDGYVYLDQSYGRRMLSDSKTKTVELDVKEDRQPVFEAIRSFDAEGGTGYIQVNAHFAQVKSPEFGTVDCDYEVKCHPDQNTQMHVSYTVKSVNGEVYVLQQDKSAGKDGNGHTNFKKFAYDRTSDSSELIAQSPMYKLDGELYSSNQENVVIGGSEVLADVNLREEFNNLNTNFEAMLEEVK